MQKKFLLIRKGKSFMLNTIVKNLVDDGYEVIRSGTGYGRNCRH